LVRRSRPLLRTFLRTAAIVAAALLATLGYTVLTLPDVRPLRTTVPRETAFMRLRADEAISAGRKPRRVQRWIGYGQVSPSLIRAVTVTEDADFWGHDGIDLTEMRASLESFFERGGTLRGGSTITQQLAKNLYLSPSRNPYRKVRELLIARRLEAELSKRRILELYLNLIEWGDGIWGAEAAAGAYFGVSAADLSPEQAALLAGAIINPRVYNPARPNARLRQRQAIILGRMGPQAPPEDIQTPPPPPPLPLLPPGGGSTRRMPTTRSRQYAASYRSTRTTLPVPGAWTNSPGRSGPSTIPTCVAPGPMVVKKMRSPA
jgi:monofunctional biosynthetic peptidoglycan transglycosylase